MVYTKASGPNNTLHYIWSTIGGAPGFMVVDTEPYQNLTVNWEQLSNQSATNRISFGNPKPRNSVGVIVSSIFFWDDTHDDGVFNKSADTISRLDWGTFVLTDITNSTMGSNSQESKATFLLINSDNLTISFDVSTQTTAGRAEKLPHLLFTPESFHVEGIVSGESNFTYKLLRMGMEVTVFHQTRGYSMSRQRSIDDEYTPGVFSKYTMSFKNNSDETSYVEWKPVTYSKPERIIAHTLDANFLLDSEEVMEPPEINLPMSGFYSDFPSNEYQVTRYDLTMGSKKEPYFSDSNYTSFSFVSGLGSAPEEKLSFGVEMIIIVGFGLPLVAMILSALYIVIKRLRRGKRDLLLEVEGPEYGTS